MAKKSFKPVFDSPVVILFASLSVAIFLLDVFFPDAKPVEKFFVCHGAKSSVAFNFKSPLDYLRMFTYAFGCAGWNSFFVNLLAVLLIGPSLEERYGSPILALMIFISVLVGGVLCACISPYEIRGASGIVFMMIVLCSLTTLMKKQILVSWIFVFAFYFWFEFYQDFPAEKISFVEILQQKVPVFISLISGICGSLFGFFVAPKKREPKKNSAETIQPSPKKNFSSDETIVGSLEL